MTDWDSFTACVATKEETFAEVLRTEALKIFDDSKPAAMKAMEAVVRWWNTLDGKIKATLVVVGSQLSPEAWKKLGAAVFSAAALRVAAFLALIAAGFALGTVMSASALCLAQD